MRSRSRLILISVLVCCFSLQTSLVYLDDTGRRTPKLSDAARRGWQLWHDNNCQSCHQLYGFGGFLGSDLTNAVPALATEHVHAMLTVGMAPMPAFHFSTDEIAAISAFLTELDATGTGQFRFAQIPSATEVLDEILSARTTAQWMEVFAGALPSAPVYDIAQALDNPFFVERGGVQTVAHPDRPDLKLVASPYRLDEAIPDRPGPKLGADTDDILRQLGYADDEIAALKKSGAV